MDDLLALIIKADAGAPKAQISVANYIIWDQPDEPIEPDWLERALEYLTDAARQKFRQA